jgi:hypothetical protein
VVTVETVFRNGFEPQQLVMPHITVHQALAFFQAHDLSIQLVSLMLFNLSVELVSLMVQEFESWWGQGEAAYCCL